MKLNLGAKKNLLNASLKTVLDILLLSHLDFEKKKMFLWLHITLGCFFSGKIADWTDDELDTTSEAIGLGAVK